MIRAGLRAAAALLATLAVCLSLSVAAAEGEPSLASIPTGKGLPVVVRAALSFNEVSGFDDTKETFEATGDVRLTWSDTRLRYPETDALHGYKEYRGAAAAEEIARIWTPRIRYPNRIGEPEFTEQRLRVFPNGTVELTIRATAAYKAPVDTTRFPFDRQLLPVEMVVQEDTIETVNLDFVSPDVTFSRAAKTVEIAGWTTGAVTLKRELASGWDGDRFAKVVAALEVERVAASTIATLFIPLFASLLIPFLATWMNKAEDGGFEVEAFELGNVIIGGLFAVIALSFTVSSAFPALVSGFNTVTMLLGLNYVALAFGTVLTVAFYRYRLLAHWFGPYVQEQAFRFLSWAFPLLFIATGIAFVVVAAV